MNLSKVKFNGTFREYQQRVIDGSNKSLANGKIHVVAAPGSGKTILGLELIRQLGKPTLILSPTIAIREQWKERFDEMFLDETQDADDFFSCNLMQPKIINSITYQGLYSAWRKVRIGKEKSETDEEVEEVPESYEKLDILKFLQDNKVGTICLDEAHHLRAEWQRSLTEFKKAIENKVKIIALTATPPYDSNKNEWDKYIETCGPIDEEIFVPELIRSKTLCPHQDFVYYETKEETHLSAIGKIVAAEYAGAGDKIRLLILTDFIRANSKVLGTENEITEFGIVPIFEMLRRQNIGINFAAVSGKIVIIPNKTQDQITEIAKNENARISYKEIPNTEFCEIRFIGNNNAQKVRIITKAFNAGIVNGIVGTKSLLGEGWDSPVINSLILASFVGSFMLSNQMRGRAIRIDRYVPDKVSNIWHIATLPGDYDTMVRRFKSFVGLSYHENIIENGLARATFLQDYSPDKPIDKDQITECNEKTFEISKDRDDTRERWLTALERATDEIIIQNEYTPAKKLFFAPNKVIKRLSRATLKTYKQIGQVSKKARLNFRKIKKTKTLNIGITRCPRREKNVFYESIETLLSKIENPRYVIIKKGIFGNKFRYSFAVPDAFGRNKTTAEKFGDNANKLFMKFSTVYTKTKDGKVILQKCQARSFVSKKDSNLYGRITLKSK